ncbi:FAD-dependent oxidoreductase [Nocardia vinacea]|uniref:FAD-dependent oxidoreductase n=1 Tax=Nocardia vinacea TaxID=96468 RepID=UPI0002DC0D48|nr:FAD-dependent monooxygenase [Nocardia vinacea]
MGDAIHAMSSALGIGANTALRDAHVLGDELLAVARGGKPVLESIGAYEEQMRDYAFTAANVRSRGREDNRPPHATEVAEAATSWTNSSGPRRRPAALESPQATARYGRSSRTRDDLPFASGQGSSR